MLLFKLFIARSWYFENHVLCLAAETGIVLDFIGIIMGSSQFRNSPRGIGPAAL